MQTTSRQTEFAHAAKLRMCVYARGITLILKACVVRMALERERYR